MQEQEEKNIELKSEEYQEVLGSVPHWILRWGIMLIAVIVVGILIGSAIFKYPDTISSTMTLTGSTPTAAIIAKSSGKIQALYVSDNQIVSKSDYLAVIENSAKTEDVEYLKKYLLALKYNFDSLKTLPPKNLSLGTIQSTYSSFYIAIIDYLDFKQRDYFPQKIAITKNRIEQYQGKKSSLAYQKDIVKDQLHITREQHSRDSVLNKKGVLSAQDLENTRNQYLQGALSYENVRSSIEDLQIQIVQMQEALLDLENQYKEKISTSETQLKTYIDQLLSDIETWEMTFVLQAPLDGKITFTNYWKENQNVQPGEEIFSIVPSDKGIVMGKANLPIERSGKVEVGQKVNIRFQNFPENEFGIVRGVVKNISLVPTSAKTNAQTGNNYIVEIGLPNGLTTTYKKQLPFLPEMQAQADIITEDLSLLERFFMPLKKVLKESL